ncbi:MAG: hypothetical protein NWQ13_02475, partial [Glaciimonas sp.]|nr:hypothetical protein [Glaciimonas sp.]
QKIKKLDFYIEIISRQLLNLYNVGLPQKIDDLTTFTSVKLLNKNVQYNYAIDNSYTQPVNVNLIKNRGVNNICKQFKVYFEKEIVHVVEFNYVAQAGPANFTIDKEDCD